MRFAVEGRRLAGTARSEGDLTFHRACISGKVAFKVVLRDQSIGGRCRQFGQRRFLPRGKQRLGVLLRHRGLVLRDRLLQPGRFARLLGRRHLEYGCGVARFPIEPLFGDRVEEGKKAVVVLLRDRVELVIMAARAAHREPHEDVRRGVHAVGDVLHLVLLGNRPALVVDHVIAIEAARQFLLRGGVGQQIARQLLDAEAVERYVAIEGVDHPIAPLPHVALRIDVVAVGIGIARQVEPLHRHAFAVLRQRKQAVHLLLVSVRRFVGDKSVDLRRRRRQAGEIEAQSAQQRRAVGLRCGLEPFAFQARQHKAVDGVARPLLIAYRRQRGTHGRGEGPVPLPLRALLDPLAHQFHLRRGEHNPSLRGRHAR